jgi:hypothetical protein
VLAPLIWLPSSFTLMRIVAPASTSRRNTSVAPFESPATRFEAAW